MNSVARRIVDNDDIADFPEEAIERGLLDYWDTPVLLPPEFDYLFRPPLQPSRPPIEPALPKPTPLPSPLIYPLINLHLRAGVRLFVSVLTTIPHRLLMAVWLMPMHGEQP